MTESIVTIGVICVVAAIVGGLLKWGPVEFPEIPLGRALILGAFGLCLIVGGVGPAKFRHSLEGAGSPHPSPGSAEHGAAPTDRDSGPAATPTHSQAVKTFWSGALKFPVVNGDAGYSFDVRPPRSIENKNVEYEWIGGGFSVGSDSGMQLAEWASDSVPTRDQCATTVTSDGSEGTGSLSAGSQICGTTSEGRTFLVKVDHRKPGDGLYTHLTVWSR